MLISAVGDTVAEDEVVLEIETDKVSTSCYLFGNTLSVVIIYSCAPPIKLLFI